MSISSNNPESQEKSARSAQDEYERFLVARPIGRDGWTVFQEIATSLGERWRSMAYPANYTIVDLEVRASFRIRADGRLFTKDRTDEVDEALGEADRRRGQLERHLEARDRAIVLLNQAADAESNRLRNELSVLTDEAKRVPDLEADLNKLEDEVERLQRELRIANKALEQKDAEARQQREALAVAASRNDELTSELSAYQLGDTNSEVVGGPGELPEWAASRILMLDRLTQYVNLHAGSLNLLPGADVVEVAVHNLQGIVQRKTTKAERFRDDEERRFWSRAAVHHGFEKADELLRARRERW